MVKAVNVPMSMDRWPGTANWGIQTTSSKYNFGSSFGANFVEKLFGTMLILCCCFVFLKIFFGNNTARMTLMLSVWPQILAL